MKIVKVSWTDSELNSGWNSVRSYKKFARNGSRHSYTTVGALIEDCEEFILVAQSWSVRPGRVVDAGMKIPRGCVRKVKILDG